MDHSANAPVNWSEKILTECIGEELPPCQAACPLDIRVREKLRLMQQGDLAPWPWSWSAAPSPASWAASAPISVSRPGTRNSLDQPLAIAGLKRYLADLDPEAVFNLTPGTERSQQVAVAGGGPGEAHRCLNCACSQCVKNCTFLQHYVQQFPCTEKELIRLLRERGICCGSGGMVPAVAPELAKKMTDFRLSEATQDLVTYCASC